MANRNRTAEIIADFVKMLRNYFISSGYYTEEEAQEFIIPGKLMDYSTPLAKPFICVIRGPIQYRQMTINNNIRKFMPTSADQTISKDITGSYMLSQKIAMDSAIMIIVYANNLLELENLIDEITFLVIGFTRIIEEEYKLQFIGAPTVSDSNYVEDNKQVWTASISIPFEHHFDYTLELRRDVYNDIYIGGQP